MTPMHPIVREIADDDRAHDPWGAGMAALGTICDVLYVEGETVPPECGYRPAMGFGRDALARYPHEFGDAGDLLAGLHPEEFPGHWVPGYAPNLTHADLTYAARVLCRYLDIVRLAGRDY